ncbi:hypothetical protein M1D51_19505 [Arthrobacter sp. R3-55]
MADASRKPSTQFRVEKAAGEWWTMTYGGPQGRGVHWDPISPDEQPQTPDCSRTYAESAPDDDLRAKQWSGFFEDLLYWFLDAAKPYVKEAFEEAKPYMKVWFEDVALPWMKTKAKIAWDHLMKKKLAASNPAPTPKEARVTDVDPSTAIDLAKGVEAAQGHTPDLTPEQARKQLEDIADLTRFVALRLKELSDAVIRDPGESDEMFLARQKQAEQLALHNVTANIQLMLIQGMDLGEAVALLADSPLLYAAGKVEAGVRRIERSSESPRASQPRK